jgi:3',5'-cyclic AMP phosphodiesterase CpdA
VRHILALGLLLFAIGGQRPQAAPFFFLQFSDPQFGMFTADKDFAQETVNFEMVVATANRLRPAFVVVTGDLVNKPGDPAQVAEYLRIARRLDPAIPLYNVAGNHDVENAPTAASIAAYTRDFGPDRYVFREAGVFGIVLNSSLIHSPDKAGDLEARQAEWLAEALEQGRASGAPHRIVFQHHPWFLKAEDEPDGYFNIPLARRSGYLQQMRAAGVRYLVSGHYHRNAIATAGGLQAITTGPVGMPLGEGTQSGIRVFIVNGEAITHRYYALGELPNVIRP